jgi:hypothetical protein
MSLGRTRETVSPKSLQRPSEQLNKVHEHAPPGQIPPRPDASREADALKIVNRAAHFVDLRIAAVHNAACSWERCHWYAPITTRRLSSTDVSVRLNNLATVGDTPLAYGPPDGKTQKPRTVSRPGLLFSADAKVAYFFAGGRSVHDPCATSAAMPMLSPSVGCG